MVIVCVCTGKLAVNSTILPSAEPHLSISASVAVANGQCTFPTNVSNNIVTSSTSRDVTACNGVVAVAGAGCCHGFQPETVSTTTTPMIRYVRSPPYDVAEDDGRLSAEQSTTVASQTECHYLLYDDVTKPPSCDVTEAAAAAETSAIGNTTAAELSSNSLSSFMTSDDVTSSFDADYDADVIDYDYDVTDREVVAGKTHIVTGSAASVNRLSSVVGQLLALALDHNDCNHRVIVDTFLRRVLPETVSATICTGSTG